MTPPSLRRPRAADWLSYGLLAVIVVAGLALRVVNNDYGLPQVYNLDEAAHFTSRAVEMFRGDFNPDYWQNPSAYTYLVFLALALVDWGGTLAPTYTVATPPGAAENILITTPSVGDQFLVDPTLIWVTARSVAALLAMVGVVVAFFVARRLWGPREGVVAAAVLAFAFLPVAYSRIAVTDVGTFAPVALALLGAIRVYEGGGRRWFLLAGAATGLAVGFKYTAGLVVLPLLGAAALRLWRAREGRAGVLASTALGLAAMVAAFLVTTPTILLEPVRALAQIRSQAGVIGDTDKYGQQADSGVVYYLETLTWGLGWAAAIAALVGAATELRRNRARAALLLAFPVVFFAYLALQSRWFGRYFLPAYPVLAMLAAVGVVRVAQLVRGLTALRVAILCLLTLAVVAQPLVADLRTTEVLGREHTLQSAREFLAERFPPGLRVALPLGATHLDTVVSNRWDRPTGLAALTGRRQLALTRRRQFVPARAVIRDLDPAMLDGYRARGVCVLVTTSNERGKAENARERGALDYYRRLERESRLIFTASPYRRGAAPLPWHYDLSTNFYPTAYERPGPAVWIYRLERCQQRYGELSAREERLPKQAPPPSETGV